MKRQVPISKVMTADVQTVQVTAKLSEVHELMRKGGFHHVPILDGDQLVGIISARDLVQLGLETSGSGGMRGSADLDERYSIGDVMTKDTDLVTMIFDDTFEEAGELLAEGDFHSVLVVDRDDKLVGITTSVDLLGYLFDR